MRIPAVTALTDAAGPHTPSTPTGREVDAHRDALEPGRRRSRRSFGATADRRAPTPTRTLRIRVRP